MEVEFEDRKATTKDWLTFIAFVAILLIIGFGIGLCVGRNHPSSKAMERELTEIKNEVDSLELTYREIIDNQDIAIEWRDSLIHVMKMEITKGEPYNLPIEVHINARN